MIKLDDFLSKKKEPAQVLDLSKVKITSKEEFKRYFDKIPDCKVKPEKVAPEQVKIKDKDFTFYPGKKEEKYLKEWNYPDPTPPDMKGTKLEDLCPINIDWKMLTTIRPSSKVDEDFFSRLVQLGKLDLKYQGSIKREKITDWVRRTKNPKSSITEMKVISCKECEEDFCDGSLCCKLTYENFFRPQPTTSNLTQNLSFLVAEAEAKASNKNKKSKKKKRKKRKDKNKTGEDEVKKRKRKRKLGKSSIFNRPSTTGCTRDHESRKRTGVTEEKPRFKALRSTRSFSCERRRTNNFPMRSKSAPRIHFDRDIKDSEYKRSECISDSAPSNTDYSSQSESESLDRQFYSPHLKLSGRRKLLSSRVSFAERKRRRESAESTRSTFVRQCTLSKGYASEEGEKFGTASESSSPARSRSLSKFTGKNPLKYFSPPSKPPATVQIQFDDEFYSPWSLQSRNRVALSIGAPMGVARTKNLFLKKARESEKCRENVSQSESREFSIDSGIRGRRSTSRRQTKIMDSFNKSSKFDSSGLKEPCLKAKGLFGKKNGGD